MGAHNNDINKDQGQFDLKAVKAWIYNQIRLTTSTTLIYIRNTRLYKWNWTQWNLKSSFEKFDVLKSEIYRTHQLDWNFGHRSVNRTF